MNCQICDKPPSPYPNWLISKGLASHVGCLAEDYQLLLAEHLRLLHEANVLGTYGPWVDDWKGSWSEKHWDNIDDLKKTL